MHRQLSFILITKGNVMQFPLFTTISAIYHVVVFQTKHGHIIYIIYYTKGDKVAYTQT